MSSFLHSPAWKRFQERIGNTVESQNDQLFVHKKVHFADYWISSRLNLKNDFSVPEFSTGSHFLRLEPEDISSLEKIKTLATKDSLTLIPTFSVQPRQTLLLDLSQSEEKILAGMKQKHRYNLKKAQGADLEFEAQSTDLVNHFSRFWTLLSATASRQDFRTHGRNHYESMLAELEKDGQAHLMFVKKDGVDLAALMLITYEGTATYLHGASGEDKGLRAPFLLHFETMKYAKKLKCTSYDFWGTNLVKNKETGEWQPQEGHASAGTSRFKIGFGGTVLEYPGAYDLILKPFWYTLYKITRRLRGGKRAFA